MSRRHRTCAAGLLAAALAISGAFAQTTTTSTIELKNFEILAVDGNYLVVRDQTGTRELHVPADFRFNVDGKSLGVADLKAGMKGTAAVTKTTTTRQVSVTEVKSGTVLSQTGKSIIVKEDTGKIHRFTQSGIDERGIQLFVADKPVRLFNLEAGDKITARIVTAGPPEVLTQTQVDAVLAKETPSAAPVPPAERPAPEPAPAATTAQPAAEPAAEPEPAPVEAAAAPVTEPAPEAAPASETVEEPGRTWLWVLLVIVLLAVIWLVMRNREQNKKSQ